MKVGENMPKRVYLSKVSEGEIELFFSGSEDFKSADKEDCILVTDKRIYIASKGSNNLYTSIETINISDVIKVQYGIPKVNKGFFKKPLKVLAIILLFPFSAIYLLYILNKKIEAWTTIEYIGGKMHVKIKNKDYSIFVNLRNAIFTAKDKLKLENTPKAILPPRPQK